MRTRIRRICILVTLLSGCAEASSQWAGTIETMENGARLVRNPETGLWSQDEGEPWVLEEELRIGREDGAGSDVFGAIGSIHVDATGRIYIVETQAREVRVFAPDGTMLRVLGGEGEGPGEFRSVSGVFPDGSGATWVTDPGNARYTRFDSLGTLLETRPRESRAMGGGPFLGGLTADGVLYDTDLNVPDESADLPPLMLAAGMGGTRLILRAMFAVDGRAVSDTIELPATTVEPVTFRTQGMIMGSPFNVRLHMLFDPSGSIWWGESAEYRVFRRTLEGDTLMVIERAYTPVPVTADEIDEWLASDGAKRFRERGGELDPSQLQDVKPVFDGIFLDDAGFLWVRRITAEPDLRFDVFDPEGRYLGAVTGPSEMVRQAPVIMGDRLYAVVRGEYDVPYVVRYHIRGRE